MNLIPDIDMKIGRVILLALATSTLATAQTYTLTSPDGAISVEVGTKSHLTISITRGGDQILAPSPIGLTTADGHDIGSTAKVKKPKVTGYVEPIDAPLYRQQSIEMAYRQMEMKLADGFGLEVRAYNEGVAYRFTTTQKKETVIKSETADYVFGADRKAWLPYTTNDANPFAMAFQNIYTETTIGQAPSKPAFLPATVDCGKAKVTILESDIVSYPGMWLQPSGDTLSALFAPYPKTMDYYPYRHMTHVTAAEDYIARSTGARTYPWRVLAITTDDTQMPTNNLVYALARPNKIGATDWIKPGKVAWDWWNDWNLKGVSFEAGINYETYCYYIDFAAAHGLEYVVLDEGWYDSKAGTILKPIDALRLPDLIKRASDKGVSIVLWAVFNVMDENLEEICSHYAAMGIKGFKVDFMDRDDQTAVEMVERLASCTAKHKLVLDLHGIYKPAGLNRTYPNIINYESVFGMEECRWTEAKNDMPLYDVTFPYIRMMAGPVDFTPGAMRNGTRSNWAAIYTKPVSMGTRCHQAACYVVHDSPFTMLADAPTSYEADETYTRFIASIPTVMDRMIVPQGEMGKYIVVAREKDGAWYVGGQANWDGRDIELTFGYLESGATYDAEILKDGINANHDAEDYTIEKATIDSSSKLPISMAQGGGFVVKLRKR